VERGGLGGCLLPNQQSAHQQRDGSPHTFTPETSLLPV
jgi:hypothetical protein